MASRKSRANSSASDASNTANMSRTLSSLGITLEQFQAKQAELMKGLLQNEPFSPQPANACALASFDLSSHAGPSSSRSRSSSLSSSTSSRAHSPACPRTPMRSAQETSRFPFPPRDQMEAIIERRNRAREEGKKAGREMTAASSGPGGEEYTPRAAVLPPGTPHHYRHYSERVVSSASSSKQTPDPKRVPETPSRKKGKTAFKMPPPRASILQTPSGRIYGSSVPATPRSSPPPEINLVSSPGPMRQDPPKEEQLPFMLPPGPYSTIKPDIGYAAIIGRAILASPGHALALQDIYEYITTVFPHYKRGETTWMNSVRHALSTMAVFRKVTRGRAEGKSLWAIHDCDLPCFEGGGFKKTLCADMVAAAAMSKGPKKRVATDSGGNPRSKKKKVVAEPPPMTMPTPMLPPLFPHFAPSNPHHQPYYSSAFLPQQPQLPVEAIFPPLPPSSNLYRAAPLVSSNPLPEDPSSDCELIPEPSTDPGTDTEVEDLLYPSSPIQRPPSSSSVPDLEPVSTLSSSSSPAPSSHPSLGDGTSRGVSPAAASCPIPAFSNLDDSDFFDDLFKDDSVANQVMLASEKPRPSQLDSLAHKMLSATHASTNIPIP
ncbi:uncharacterized protein BXZ73DRAFT_76772 [Epithele typhae]|uniref:uncharacterized protein n=1 Tax=Epithele typhae TaxID=378194 RepID=UPI00200736B7|nr:uncharacterized protein BXZ73DRAFT_76772 [Epithele typhae]KAH9935965.1 hypothetical protein BXZ73DRAFT_76772 [Epithele typhae]